MKKLVAKKDVRCMACLSCVRACSEAFYKVFDQAKSCVQIVEKNGGVKVNTVFSAASACAPVSMSHYPESQDGRVHDQQKIVYGLRRVRGSLSYEGHDAGRRGRQSVLPAASASRPVPWNWLEIVEK